MVHRGLQRASLGLVAAAFGCTTLSGVNEFEVDRATSGPDSAPAPRGTSTEPQGSKDTEAEAASDGGAGDTGDTGERDATRPAKRVFVTSATFSGNVGGLDGADSQCRAAAAAANLGSNDWKAWLSTKSVNALSRLPYAGAYVLIDGTLVTNNATELVSGALQHPIDIDEYGTMAGSDGGSTLVWTSTDEHGQAKTASTCLTWTSGSYWDWGDTGSATSIGADWTNGGGRRCSDGAHLYCFEQ